MGMFSNFRPIYMALGANPTGHFWLVFLLETRLKSASFEPLTGCNQNYDSKT